MGGDGGESRVWTCVRQVQVCEALKAGEALQALACHLGVRQIQHLQVGQPGDSRTAPADQP